MAEDGVRALQKVAAIQLLVAQVATAVEEPEPTPSLQLLKRFNKGVDTPLEGPSS